MVFRSLALTDGSEMVLLESFGGELCLDDLAGLFPPSTVAGRFFIVHGAAVFSCVFPVLRGLLLEAGAVLDGRASPSSSNFLILD